ncbi:hypothetical protein LZ32DRAFT_307904 [Colletotrichum eremochloae]|nr:hypothetical protein LZ32DRAFT_307904 [Colletotrichum eremochloae]
MYNVSTGHRRNCRLTRVTGVGGRGAREEGKERQEGIASFLLLSRCCCQGKLRVSWLALLLACLLACFLPPFLLAHSPACLPEWGAASFPSNRLPV